MRRPVLSLITFVILLLCIFGTSVSTQAQAPNISDLYPPSAPIGGQFRFNAQNVGLPPGTVTVNGISAVVDGWDIPFIFAEVPPGAKKGPIVITFDGVQSNALTFSIIPAPSITSVLPSSGPIGTSITITGTNFDPLGINFYSWASFYPVGGCSICEVALATPTSLSNTSIVVQVPVGATPGKVDVGYDLVDGAPVNFTVTGTLAPVADAGLYEVVPLGSTVRLDGTQSYDLNGLPLTYQWSFCQSSFSPPGFCSIPTGSQAVLLNPTSPMPTFVPDIAGEYDVTLVVNNGTLSSIQACPSVSIFAGTTSGGGTYTNAGPDQTVKV